MNVLVACEVSQIVVSAFRKKGHKAYSCDVLPTEGNPGWHIQADVLTVLDRGWDLMIAHPSCTFLAVTGNKWNKPEYESRFPNRKKERKEAIAFFMALVEADIHYKCIENPVGIMSTIYRKPDQIIQPFMFGHVEPKKTCLWLFNLPKLRYGAEPQMMLGEETPPSRTEIKEPEYHIAKSGKRLPRWYFYADKSQGQEHRASIRSKTF